MSWKFWKNDFNNKVLNKIKKSKESKTHLEVIKIIKENNLNENNLYDIFEKSLDLGKFYFCYLFVKEFNLNLDKYNVSFFENSFFKYLDEILNLENKYEDFFQENIVLFLDLCKFKTSYSRKILLSGVWKLTDYFINKLGYEKLNDTEAEIFIEKCKFHLLDFVFSINGENNEYIFEKIFNRNFKNPEIFINMFKKLNKKRTKQINFNRNISNLIQMKNDNFQEYLKIIKDKNDLLFDKYNKGFEKQKLFELLFKKIVRYEEYNNMNKIQKSINEIFMQVSIKDENLYLVHLINTIKDEQTFFLFQKKDFFKPKNDSDGVIVYNDKEKFITETIKEINRAININKQFDHPIGFAILTLPRYKKTNPDKENQAKVIHLDFSKEFKFAA